MIENRKFKMAIGESVHDLPEDEVVQDVHGTKGVIRGELTLETLGERHNAVALNLSGLFNEFLLAFLGAGMLLGSMLVVVV